MFRIFFRQNCLGWCSSHNPLQDYQETVSNMFNKFPESRHVFQLCGRPTGPSHYCFMPGWFYQSYDLSAHIYPQALQLLKISLLKNPLAAPVWVRKRTLIWPTSAYYMTLQFLNLASYPSFPSWYFSIHIAHLPAHCEDLQCSVLWAFALSINSFCYFSPKWTDGSFLKVLCTMEQSLCTLWIFFAFIDLVKG